MIEPVADVYHSWYQANLGLLDIDLPSKRDGPSINELFAACGANNLKHMGYASLMMTTTHRVFLDREQVEWLQTNCAGGNYAVLYPPDATQIFFTTDDLAVQFRLTFPEWQA